MHRVDVSVIGAASAAGFTLLVAVFGIGRLGASNTVYITLRQIAAIAHVALPTGWFYLRATR